MVSGQKLTEMKNPMQPIGEDDCGRLRFKRNLIVRDLLDFASDRGMNLNTIAAGGYTDDDRRQFAQLIGYSLSGYGELDYVGDEDFEAARLASRGEENPRAVAAEAILSEVREGMRAAAAKLYGIHPDDLKRL